MLVDDNKAFLEIFTLSAPAHWQISTFNNPLHAIKAFKNNRFDLLIIDVMMPNIHGLHLAEISQDLIDDVNIVLISANNETTIEKDLGYSTEAFSFYRKPLEEDFFEYIDHLEKAIAAKKPTENSETSNTQGIKLNHFCLLGDLYKDYHHRMYNVLMQKLSLASDYDYNEIKTLHTRLNNALELISCDNPDKQQKIIHKLQSEYGSWQSKVLEEPDKFIKDQKYVAEVPFQSKVLGTNFDGKIYNISICLKDKQTVELAINDRVQIPSKNMQMDYDYQSEAGRIVYFAWVLKYFKESCSRHHHALVSLPLETPS